MKFVFENNLVYGIIISLMIFIIFGIIYLRYLEPRSRAENDWTETDTFKQQNEVFKKEMEKAVGRKKPLIKFSKTGELIITPPVNPVYPDCNIDNFSSKIYGYFGNHIKTINYE